MLSKNFFQPAEWAPHQAVWLAWPSHAELWREHLASAQQEFTSLCEAITDLKDGQPQGEALKILVTDGRAKKAAEKALGHLRPTFYEIPFGDIWLRDTAPIFVQHRDLGGVAGVCFSFNGWGGKYSLPYDKQVAESIAKVCRLPSVKSRLVLEGGSIEPDGAGTCLTTQQCLLNRNRNGRMKKTEIETILADTLGYQKILWLKDGLLNDHTDGHIDTIARFAREGEVVCMTPSGVDDPNIAVLEQIKTDLETFVDAKGRKLKVHSIPSPGLVLDEDGRVMPASYVNFYISNTTVVIPIYGCAYDEAAIQALEKIFPDRRCVGVSARAILAGGGAFHCITQQVPREGL